MRSLWRGNALLLASTSATRRALLEAAGLPIETCAPGVDERAVEAAASGLTPEALALRLAEAKALAVAAPGRIVVGADQVLDLDGEVFHKPADAAAARAHLAHLAGRTHVLRSAAAVAEDGVLVAAFVDIARLTMRPLGAEAIARYVEAAGEGVLASVGAYQVEGLGAHLFERIEGDHATILGLPVLPLLAVLRRLGRLAI